MIDVVDAGTDDVLAVCDALVGGSDGTGARRLVDATDRAAVDARRREADARDLLAGRVLLRLLIVAMASATPADPALVAIDRTCPGCGRPHGRPRTEGLALSSSRTDGRVLVAVSPVDLLVGVDVERLPPRLFGGFDRYVRHPAETPPAADEAGLVAESIGLWVDKEAVLKSVGVGLAMPPSAVCVAAGSGWRQVLAPADLADRVVRRWPTVRTQRAAIAATRSDPLRRRGLTELAAVVSDALSGRASG